MKQVRVWLLVLSALVLSQGTLAQEGEPEMIRQAEPIPRLYLPARYIETARLIPGYQSFAKLRDRDIFSAKPAREQPTKKERNVYLVSEAYKWGIYAFDMRTTSQVINRGGRETNPLYGLGGDRNPGAVIGISSALNLVESVAIYKFVYKRGHPRVAAGINFVVGSLHLGYGLHNRTVCRPICYPR